MAAFFASDFQSRKGRSPSSGMPLRPLGARRMSPTRSLHRPRAVDPNGPAFVRSKVEPSPLRPRASGGIGPPLLRDRSPAPSPSVPGVDRTEIRTGHRARARERGQSPARRGCGPCSATIRPCGDLLFGAALGRIVSEVGPLWVRDSCSVSEVSQAEAAPRAGSWKATSLPRRDLEPKWLRRPTTGPRMHRAAPRARDGPGTLRAPGRHIAGPLALR